MLNQHERGYKINTVITKLTTIQIQDFESVYERQTKNGIQHKK